MQYKVEPVTAGIETLGTAIMSLPQNATMTLKAGLAKGAVKTLTDAGTVVLGKDESMWGAANFGKAAGAYGAATVMLMGAIAATIYIWLMKKHKTIKMPELGRPAVANAFTGIVPAAVALYGVGIKNYLFTEFGTTVIEFIAKVLQEPLLSLREGYGLVLIMTILG